MMQGIDPEMVPDPNLPPASPIVSPQIPNQRGIGGMPRSGVEGLPTVRGIDQMRQAPRDIFKGFMASGGYLRRPGEWAVVGEDGPELVQTDGQGAMVAPIPTQNDAVADDPAVDNNSAAAQQLLDIGNASKAGVLYRDPSRYTMPSGQTFQPETLDAGYTTVPENSGSLPQEPFDQNAPPPMAPGRYGDSIPELQRQAGDIDSQIALTKQGKDGGPRERSLWKRFGKGFLDAWKNWDPKDGSGLFGGLVQAAAGGVGSAVSPQAHQVGRLQTQKNDILGRLGQRYTMQAQDNQLLQQEGQIANLQNQIVNRNAQTQINAAKVVSDANKAKVVQRNGKVYRQYSDGREVIAPDIPSTQVKQKLADGSEVWVEGKDALNAEAQKAYRQAQLEFESKKLNAKQLEDYQQNLVKWSNELDEHQSKVSQLILDGQAKQNQAAEYDAQANDPALLPSEKLEAKAKATQLRTEGNALVNRGNELRSHPPKKPELPQGDVSAPTIGGRSVSRGDLTAFAKSKGWTMEQAEQYARNNGWTIK